MTRDLERINRIINALEPADQDALICSLPMNVLLISGYWPVIGTALAIATRDGAITILAPQDEEELARRGWADEVRTFSAGSLKELKRVADIVRKPLGEIANDMGIGRNSVVGYESAACFEPVSYAAMHLYGAEIFNLLDEALPSIALRPADELLIRLRSVLTPVERDRVQKACRIAERAFNEGKQSLHAGLKETEVASYFRAPLNNPGPDEGDVARADGFVFCMSGPNSVQAYAAYQRSRDREIQQGEFALIHCNSYVDGYWTDITRTFCLGAADEQMRRMYDAVFAARRAALETIRPGVKAAVVDQAAREVLQSRGFGEEFKHGLGHGVGFAAINHNAPPRLHPASEDVLEAGMIFNIEPAIYIESFGGLRHCDMVLVTKEGAEVLTPFLSNPEQLTIT